MKRWIYGLKSTFLFCLGLGFSAYVMADNSPMPMVVEMNQKVLAELKKHKSELKAHPQYVVGAIKSYFMPHVDTQGMARSVLGRNAWQSATAADKEAFTNEFTALVLRTYAQPISHYDGEKVEFLNMKPSPASRFAQVQTIIVRPNGQRIPMTYHLILMANNQWKVYDLSVEGVSLLNSFRNQFGDALKQDSLRAVINELHQRNKKLVS